MIRHSATATATTVPVRWLRSLATLAALALGLLICSEEADAQLEGVRGFASGTVVADDSSILPQLFPRQIVLPEVAQPTHPGGSLGGLFNRPGLLGGFAAGFLGAGLLGLVFGHGMIGELSGVFPLLGLVFQLTLIVLLGRLIWTWWRTDKAAALPDLSPRQLADAYGRSRHEMPPDIDARTGARLSQPNDGVLTQRDRAGR